MKITDKLRAEAVALYRQGFMTQAEVCAAIETKTGRLSPRTLRSWLSSSLTAGRPGPARDRLRRALEPNTTLAAASLSPVPTEMSPTTTRPKNRNFWD